MRIAVLADIHGNLPALEAVLEHAQRHRPDLIAVAGDVVVGGPDSGACWRTIRRLQLPLVRGNHERYLLAAADGDPAYAGPNWAPAQWAAAQLTPAEHDEIRTLPLTRALVPADEGGGLLLTHAAPGNDYVHLAPTTPAEIVLEQFGAAAEATVVRGHNHLAFERRVGGRPIHVIAIGSVGLPLDGHPQAQYALLDADGDGWEATFVRIPYDVDAAVQAFYDSGYLEAAGPIARLFLREVATGAHQLVPFMRHYQRWREREEIALEQALERFLTMY